MNVLVMARLATEFRAFQTRASRLALQTNNAPRSQQAPVRNHVRSGTVLVPVNRSRLTRCLKFEPPSRIRFAYARHLPAAPTHKSASHRQ